MKVLVVVSLLVLTVSTIAQEKPYPILDFEMRNVLCSEQIKAELDLFLNKLAEDRLSRAVIVAKADAKIEGRIETYVGALRRALLFRKFPEDRVTFVRGE